MASLEYIDFKPWRETIHGESVTWEPDTLSRSIPRLPQIFWNNGAGWDEANHWALEKATQVRIETAWALMKHVCAYASFLEAKELDWRHFPMRIGDRTIVRFRGHLISQMDRGSLASSTARARMNAVIQFYRHADAHDFITPETPMWREKSVVIPYYDSVGFKRILVRVKTDLAIPNRARPGVTLEDGLTPLRSEHMVELLRHAKSRRLTELHLMLLTGFFTGARIGTITTLRIENLEKALPDPYMKGFFLLRVGPGTRVATKFNVEGNLLVPDFLLKALKDYAYSPRRLLKREAKAKPSHRSVLFLTVRGNPYKQSSIARLMTDLRRETIAAGLKFMKRFKFHQTRATYGTWFMTIALSVTTEANAIALVKGAMLHKNEAYTLRYVRFIGVSKGKEEAAAAFTAAFTGMRNRNWDDFRA